MTPTETLSGTQGSQETSLDEFLGGRLHIEQPLKGYRAGLDPVMLAAACQISRKQKILDLGCGVGTAALCLAARCPGLEIVGVDDQPRRLGLANNNIERNSVSSTLSFLAARVPDIAITPDSFDLVLTNPPYFKAGTSRPGGTDRESANVESVPLDVWLQTAHRMLRSHGSLCMIHQAARLDDVINAMGQRFGGIVIFPLWPASGASEAKRVIVSAIKGSKAPTRLSSGLVLHETGGGFTEKAKNILQKGAALDIPI